MTRPGATVDTLRWGVLSTAGIARVVGAANSGRFRAVAGRDPAKTAAFAADTGIERTFDGYAAMLASDEVDAVYVALPTSMHAEWTVAALEAGKHVLCEKPFAWSAADAGRCFDAAEAAGRVCAEGFMWRVHPRTVLARRLVADGVIGRVATVRAALRVSVGPGDIRRSIALGGGALGDLGAYCVSAIRLFGSEPLTVTADAVFEEVDTRFGGVLRCREEVLGVFDCALDLPRADELEVIGTEGVLRLPDPWLCRAPGGRSPEVVVIRDGAEERIPSDPDGRLGLTGTDHDAYRIEFDTFEQVVAGARPAPFGRSDAVAQAATLEALLQAARTGESVAL
jgi:D-xylose 1-dehydrogenase (NADP+, D-xylono-1,5-lactone-forming)